MTLEYFFHYSLQIMYAYILILRSLEEHSLLAQLLPDINSKDTWSGLLCQADGNDSPTYVWSDSPFLDKAQTAWADGEPN